MRSHDYSAEFDRLLREMDYVDDALASHLRGVIMARKHRRQGLPPLKFMRLQIKTWCIAAMRRGVNDREVLAAMLMAVDQMDRRDLAAFVRELIYRANRMQRPAA
jgi:hypothetical protein